MFFEQESRGTTLNPSVKKGILMSMWNLLDIILLYGLAALVLLSTLVAGKETLLIVGNIWVRRRLFAIAANLERMSSLAQTKHFDGLQVKLHERAKHLGLRAHIVAHLIKMHVLLMLKYIFVALSGLFMLWRL